MSLKLEISACRNNIEIFTKQLMDAVGLSDSTSGDQQNNLKIIVIL